MNVKNKRSATVQVDYLISVQEIKPWPPTLSLRSVRSVVIHWENGARNSGHTTTVTPSVGSNVGEGKIEFNEFFKLTVTLQRDTSSRAKDGEGFKKNCLEFNLHEPRRDKTLLLATAVVDLGECGILKEAVSISTPMSSKRIVNNTCQPVLYVQVQPIDNRRLSSLPKEIPIDKNGAASVSTLMTEEYAAESESFSVTDDDVLSQSSFANGILQVPQKIMDCGDEIKTEDATAPASGNDTVCIPASLSCDLGSPVNTGILLEPPSISSVSTGNDTDLPNLKQECPSELSDSKEEVADPKEAEVADSNEADNSFSIVTSQDKDSQAIRDHSSIKFIEDVEPQSSGHILPTEQSEINCEPTNLEDMNAYNYAESNQYCLDEQEILNLPPPACSVDLLQGNSIQSDKVKHVKSVRCSIDSIRTMGLSSRSSCHKMEDTASGGSTLSRSTSFRGNETLYSPSFRNKTLENKIQQLENKIRTLEDELIESAAIEAALYSVPAEHTFSMSKVHTPARRLSRLYINACRENSQLRRSGAAKTAVSGLVLVAKACGNDVPRLTFWLSNAVVLRTILSQNRINRGELPINATYTETDGYEGNKLLSSLKWKARSFQKKDYKYNEWDDPQFFMSALERVEAWIFCRTVESIWWQVLTPHMQPTLKEVQISTLSGSKKEAGKGDQDQQTFALENWKDAFSEACEKLCPVRAEGNECGCLHILTKLIMEQCVARLDVAMFNAILREPIDDIPTDPVSDPISNSDVLPIHAAKSSFGAGAQLKTAIGNWSRWLTSLFGIDEEDSRDEDNDERDSNPDDETTFKSFHLLNELSDLMMLPKDMLLNKAIRNEVCPSFGPLLIKKILDNFVTDEFCPDPVPPIVFKTLTSEDADDDSISTVPCVAASPLYLPPSASSVAGIIGIGGCNSQSHPRRSRSLVIRKAYTSDDELDELESPLDAVLHDRWSAATRNGRRTSRLSSTIRYQRLREVWINAE